MLEWIAISFSRGSSQPRDRTQVSCIAGRCFNLWATRESESESEVAQLCPTLCHPMVGSLPDSAVHGIFQARILEWAAVSFSRGSSQPREALSKISVQFSSVQLLSCFRIFVTPWITALQASLLITNSRSPPKPMSIESMISSNHLILCRPLLLPSIFPSIRVFANEAALHMRWAKYWSFSFSISPSNEHPGLTSFRMDWLDLLAVQGTLKSLLQHHSSKASIFWCSALKPSQKTSQSGHTDHSLV